MATKELLDRLLDRKNDIKEMKDKQEEQKSKEDKVNKYLLEFDWTNCV